MTPLDDDRAVAVAVIPPMMPAAIMVIKLGAGSVIVAVAIVIAVVADAEVEPLCTCNRRRRNRKGRQRSENAGKLSHLSLLRCCTQEKNEQAMPTFREQRRNFFEQMFSLNSLPRATEREKSRRVSDKRERK